MKIINIILFAWLDGMKAKIFKQKLKEKNKKKDKSSMFIHSLLSKN